MVTAVCDFCGAQFPEMGLWQGRPHFFGPRYTGIMGLQREPVQNLDVKELKYQILDCKTVSC